MTLYRRSAMKTIAKLVVALTFLPGSACLAESAAAIDGMRRRARTSTEHREILRSFLTKPASTFSLGDDAFDEKHTALHRGLPDRFDRLVGWRIIPGTRLLRAIELDHYYPLWRFAIEALGLTATNNTVIVAIERRQRCWDPLSIFLYGSKVRYCVGF